MNLYFRLFWVLFKTWGAPRSRILDTSEVRFRTWFTDLDMNLHMNNGRFLSLMDIGRFDLVARPGLLRTIFRNRWMPLVAGVNIVFRRPLAPLQKFVLRTRIVGWDDRWIYFEQLFLVGTTIHAKALVKATIKEKGGTIPTSRLLAMLGEDLPPPEIPPEWRPIVASNPLQV
jgi:acyl-CoA thioesterase FadM